MNLDQLNCAHPREVLLSAYAALSGAQDAAPADQVLGAAVLFLTFCEELKLDPSDMLVRAGKIRRDADNHYFANVRALREFIRNEIKSK